MRCLAMKKKDSETALNGEFLLDPSLEGILKILRSSEKKWYEIL